MTQDDYIEKNIGYEAVESLPKDYQEYLDSLEPTTEQRDEAAEIITKVNSQLKDVF